MNIQQGDIYGFIGENGAGKTTFMRNGWQDLPHPHLAQSGYLDRKICRPEGTILVARLKTPALYKNMTARENLEIFRHAFGVKKYQKVQIRYCLSWGWQTPEESGVGDFSLGMKQRLAIAVALLGNPQFLILDEPINGLDPVANTRAS